MKSLRVMKFQTIVNAVLMTKTIVKHQNVATSDLKSVEKLILRILMPSPDHSKQNM